MALESGPVIELATPASHDLTRDVGSLLPALDAAFPSSIVAVLTEFLEQRIGAVGAEVYLADYDLLRLTAWREDGAPRPDSLPLDGSVPGRAFVSQTTTVSTSGEDVVAHLPVSVRAERLGVLAVTLPSLPTPTVLRGLEQTAVVLGYVLITAGNYTDTVERARRERPLELPAEMQWTQLPVRAYTCAPFSIAGQLVPAYEVGGDLFDYCVEPTELLVYVTDAMGHGLQAAMLGTLASGALRNARRTGLSLTDQVRSADRVLFGQHGGDKFVTAIALSIDLATGRGRAVNAGHPELFVLRGEGIQTVRLDPQLPMGMFEATAYVEQPFALQPGDRLVVVSDGVLDAPASADGEPYGQQRLEGAILATATAPADEAVRQLVRLLQDYQGHEVKDDATVLCVDWRGPSGP